MGRKAFDLNSSGDGYGGRVAEVDAVALISPRFMPSRLQIFLLFQSPFGLEEEEKWKQ
jgi:hypothetical protein